MQRIKHALLAVGLAMVLSGCASMGLQGPQTFKQRVDVAIKTVQAARQSAITLLEAGKISPDDAQHVQDEANLARSGIALAQQIHGTSPADGDAKLTAVIVSLQALTTYLNERENRSNANQPEQPSDRRPVGARLLHPGAAIPGHDFSYAYRGA